MDSTHNDNKFRVKSGYCHILPDQILFTSNGKIEDEPKSNLLKISWWRPILDFLLIFLLLFGGLYLATINRITPAIILAVIALYRIINMMINLIRSKIIKIDRNMIIRVRLKPGIKGISRATVKFIFKTPKGKKRRKLIILPDAADSGHAETERACQIMRKEKLIY
ncbi:MAG: hypothetical protein JW801_06075 [Bacteroidales bacterium]|nr:hypothetical protein [Bacteroidales bacterium]